MKFYYVRDNGVDFTGTCDGSIGNLGGVSAVERVGAWDANQANSFSSVKALFDSAINTDLPDDNSIVFVASDHVETYAASTNLNIGVLTNNTTVMIISSSLIDYSYQKGATIDNTASNLYVGKNTGSKTNYTIKGFNFTISGFLDAYTHLGSTPLFYDCTISLTNDKAFKSDRAVFYNCDITYWRLETTNPVFIQCKMTNYYTGYHFRNTSLSFYECDFSSSNNLKLSGNTNGLIFHQCKLPLLPFVNAPTYITWLPTIELIQCSNVNNNEYYNYYSEDYFQVYSTNTLVHLNYSYDGMNNSSMKIETNSIPNKINSSRKLKLIEIPAQDLSATDTTYRVNLLLDTATAASLSDTEFWIELSHNDNVSLALGKVVSSRNTDILAAGTELTASAETWQGTLPATYKAYQVDITLSAASLPNVTNGSVVIYANLAIPNVDVYVCPAVQIGV